MNNDQMEGKWHQLKGEVRRQWGKLTDNDVDRINGNSEKLIGTIQERYGNSREEAEKDVETWFNRNFPRTQDTA